jgi:hypothetical protein
MGQVTTADNARRAAAEKRSRAAALRQGATEFRDDAAMAEIRRKINAWSTADAEKAAAFVARIAAQPQSESELNAADEIFNEMMHEGRSS